MVYNLFSVKGGCSVKFSLLFQFILLFYLVLGFSRVYDDKNKPEYIYANWLNKKMLFIYPDYLFPTQTTNPMLNVREVIFWNWYYIPIKVSSLFLQFSIFANKSRKFKYAIEHLKIYCSQQDFHIFNFYYINPFIISSTDTFTELLRHTISDI